MNRKKIKRRLRSNRRGQCWRTLKKLFEKEDLAKTSNKGERAVELAQEITNETNEEHFGYMKDPLGRLIPNDMVSDVDRLRDQTVREIVERTKVQSEALRATKNAIMNDIYAFVALSAERWRANLGGKKGNITLTSYDGKYKVQLSVSERLAFSEGIHAAKSLVDECITRWAEGSSSEIKVLVQDAFQVDKAGTLNTHRILSLLRFDIKDTTWIRAMDAIKDSLIATGSKIYIRVYEQDSMGGYKPIPMDIAAV